MPITHESNAAPSFDEVAAHRRLRVVRGAGIEVPCGELHFEASEWLREVEDGAWRPSVMKVARVLARAFDATGTITLTHRVIAKRAKLRGTATEDALRELDQAGWLGRDQQLGGRGRGAVYRAFFASYRGAEAPEKGRDKRPAKPPAKRPEKRPALTRGRAERSLTVQEEELISDSSSSEGGSTWWDEDDEARSAAGAAPEPLRNQPASEVGGPDFPAASKHGHNVPEDLSDDLGGSTASAVTDEWLSWQDTVEPPRETEAESLAPMVPTAGAPLPLSVDDGARLASVDVLERERAGAALAEVYAQAPLARYREVQP
jgi:hypothetical protein